MQPLKLWGVVLALSIAVGAVGAAGGCSNQEAPEEEAGEGWLYGYLLDATTPHTHAGLTGPVTISVGDTPYSAEQSSFFLMKLPAGQPHVRIEAPGYAQTAFRVHVQANAARFVRFSLLPFHTFGTFDAGEDIELETPNGASVFFPANSLDSEGALTVSLAHLDADSRDALRAFPGGFLSDTGALLESFGAIAIEVRDEKGALVNLKAGASASITIPASANVPEDSIPLWFYDGEAGAWKEEGALEGCLSGFCTADIPHLAWWNADMPMETTCLRACAVDTHGNPAVDTSLEAIGVDYNSLSYNPVLDSDGCACLSVRTNARVRVVAVNAGGRVESGEISTSGTPLSCPSPECEVLLEPLVVAPPQFQAVLTWQEGEGESFSSSLAGPCHFADCAADSFLVHRANRGSLTTAPFAGLTLGLPFVGPESIALSACSQGRYIYSVRNCVPMDSHAPGPTVAFFLPGASPLTVSAPSPHNWLSWTPGELSCPNADCRQCSWVPLNTFEFDDEDDAEHLACYWD